MYKDIAMFSSRPTMTADELARAPTPVRAAQQVLEAVQASAVQRIRAAQAAVDIAHQIASTARRAAVTPQPAPSAPSSSAGPQQARAAWQAAMPAQEAPSGPPPAYTVLPQPYIRTTMRAHHTPHDDDEEDYPSQIQIHISAAVTVTGNSNLLAWSPTSHAGLLSQSIVSALRDASMNRAGIPMIDEEGRPRPVELRVEAPVKIEGERNVLGEKAVLAVVMATNSMLKNGSAAVPNPNAGAATADGVESQARKRRASDPVEDAGKRQRVA